jgi:hypothetical protein
MNQLETLFATDGGPVWRVTIQAKGGGGPFDQAGYSIECVGPAGLEILLVEPMASAQWPVDQMTQALDSAVRRLKEHLVATTQAEIKARTAAQRDRLNGR